MHMTGCDRSISDQAKALLSIEKKEAAYATLMRIMVNLDLPWPCQHLLTVTQETEHNGVEDILAKLQRSSTRPEAELRPMAEALQSREWEKTKAAIDTVWEHINRALAKTATGSITDISLEDAKIVAKGIMEGRLGPYHLEPYVRKAEPELAKADEKKEKEVEKPVGGEEKEEEGQKKPGKNAKRNAARKTARKLKRDEQTAADVNLAEGLGERESSTSNQI